MKGQHNWILFPVALPPGAHVLKVSSDTRVTLEDRFTSSRDKVWYAVVDFWNYADKQGRHITWDIRDVPIGFA